MVYPIITDPNPILHIRSLDVEKERIHTKEFQVFVKDMIETMYVKDGVGLAAVQVGKSLQVCVIAKNYSTFNPKEDLCLINPTWTKLSVFKNWDEEGCLSVPGMYGKVKRYVHVKVKALNQKGEHIEFEAHDFFARIIQHEVDHLNGILFVEKAKDLHRIDQSTKL
jgi:peptide deformylase